MKKIYSQSFLYCVNYEIVVVILRLFLGYYISVAFQEAVRDNYMVAGNKLIIVILTMMIILPLTYFLGKKKRQICFMDQYKAMCRIRQLMTEKEIKVENVGDYLRCLNKDNKIIAEYRQKSLPKIIGNCCASAGTILFLLSVNVWYAAIVLCMNAIQFIPEYFYETYAKKIYHNIRNCETEMENWILEGQEGLSDLQSYKKEKWYLKCFDLLIQKVFSSGIKAEQTGTIENIIFEAVQNILTYGSYIIAGLFILYERISFSKLPFLIIMSGYLMESIGQIYELSLNRFAYKETEKRLTEKPMSNSTVLYNGIQDNTKSEEEAAISVHNISMSYEEKNIFHNISFMIKKGEKVCLNGKNGSGKTTLIRLLTEEEHADSGIVQFFVPKDQIVCCLQEEPMLDCTGIEIIQATESENLINKPQLYELLNGFGIKKELLERNLSDLSFGERKKIFLSLILSRKKQFLILDEPGNHLDQNSIDFLMKQIQEYNGTMIICSHDKYFSDATVNREVELF